MAKIQRLVAEPERLERWRNRMAEHESDATKREPVEVGAQESESRVYLNDKPSIVPVNPPLTEMYVLLAAINDAFIDDQGDGNEVRICDDDTFPKLSLVGTECSVRKCRVDELSEGDLKILREGYLERVRGDLGVSQNGQPPEQLDAGTSVAEGVETPSRKVEKRQWLAEAMLLIQDHPEWSNAEIAEQVEIHPGQLSRSKEYKIAAALARSPKGDRRRGHITLDSKSGQRGVEAYSDDPAERDWDD
ncbi:MAG: hypothetical protein VX988_12120 [Planctomycetota bacterium]|nr:hypothetical protein [Planctomycetota bacterium]